MSEKEEKALTDFIENKRYLAAAQRLQAGGVFSLPEQISVNKSGSVKKRQVYHFPEEENYIQKLIAFKLLAYDDIFAENLYSFRQNNGVKNAVRRLFFTKGVQEMYVYKTDISDYFNSVNPALILPVLKQVLAAESRLYHLLEAMLTEPRYLADGREHTGKKGILAGSPIAGFLANLFLNEVDRHFEKEQVLYARYSDDIILFAASEGEMEQQSRVLKEMLAAKQLRINPDKEITALPHQAWNFLGFCYHDGVIDIAPVSKMKLKKKMRRKAAALVRWKKKTGAEESRAVRAFIRHFNQKLYGRQNDEITWSYWYFPVITTAESLKEIDAYAEQCIRFIATGAQNKRKYAFTYEQIKQAGFVSLVGEYYRFKSGKSRLTDQTAK